jgi:glycosyltransferase involved in cell wall biosynthesis
MGKKSKASKEASKALLPRVSICTPTFNRRPFFKGAIHNVLSQDYPHDKIEWIIVDDGMDKVGDLVQHIPFVKYVSVDQKMTLGQKRNFMHEQCTFKEDDAIIVYLDDDDYYPPMRVSHSVEMLTKHKEALCAGSSAMYIWFGGSLNKMYKFGPYGPSHATAGTFAFKRALLKQTRYEDDAALGEEKYFLKNYTVPFVQLDPLKTILVFSHEHNTFDKRRLLDPNNPMCKDSALTVNHFIRNPEIREFYMRELDVLLKDYELGTLKYKPEVVAEIQRRDAARTSQEVIVKDSMTGKDRALHPQEVIQLLKVKTEELHAVRQQLMQAEEEIIRLRRDMVHKDKLLAFFQQQQPSIPTTTIIHDN